MALAGRVVLASMGRHPYRLYRGRRGSIDHLSIVRISLLVSLLDRHDLFGLLPVALGTPFRPAFLFPEPVGAFADAMFSFVHSVLQWGAGRTHVKGGTFRTEPYADVPC